MQSTSTWTKRSKCNPSKLYGRIECGGCSYKGAPRFFRMGWSDWRVECDISPGKVSEVNSSEREDKYADLLWLENLELNRLLGGKAMTETMWKCDQVRAGRLYNRMMFDTREEAVQFMQRMQQMEPDQVFSIEAIEARQVWN
jgi:hypothetical protein